MQIKINKLSKKYEGNKVYTLKDLDLTINDKDFLVLLGPSGCGKTTLLRMIAGLNSITSGDLVFADKRVNDLSPKDRDIAMVFQSYALYPHMNVYNNIAFGLKIAKEKKDIIDRRVKDVAKILNIQEHLYSKPGDLSGGQRQRVALGRAIARKPKIFLMDEPLSNLDAKLRERMRSELVRIHNMLKTTSVYVTHDQLEAMTMATKIVLMNDKQIVQVGTPSEIFDKPNSIFAAKFIGTPSMNLIEGTFNGKEFVADKNIFKTTPSKKHIGLMKEFEIKKSFMGIRGKDISISTTKPKGADFILKAEVSVIENLGPEMQIIFDYDNNKTITVTTDLKDLKVGKLYYISGKNTAFHFYDHDSTQRITKTFKDLKLKWELHQEFLKSQEQDLIKVSLFQKIKTKFANNKKPHKIQE